DYVADAVLICVSVIVLRLVWVPIFTYLPRFLFRSVRERDPYPPWQAPAVISWSGIRGGVSLAAALALPTGFPDRDLIVFVTFCVTVVTLVGQGMTLPSLIRAIRVPADDGGAAHEDAKARIKAAEAALARLEELIADDAVRPVVLAANDLGDDELRPRLQLVRHGEVHGRLVAHHPEAGAREAGLAVPPDEQLVVPVLPLGQPRDAQLHGRVADLVRRSDTE